VEFQALGSSLIPRYTFRVVGDHIGDRSDRIERIGLGDVVYLVREPTNPYDANAVLVIDSMRQQLGYLKREVASWFGPMLDRGYGCHCQAYRKPSSGGLIVAVFQD
jgi:HIRAN domain